MSSQSVNTINLDIFEPNDSRETATDLGLISEWNYWDNLSIHARDSDWFKFEIAQTGSVNNYLSISSWFHGENLNLSLYDSEGVLIYSTSSDGEERISLEGIEAGTYYFNIQGDDGVIRPSYSLYINAPWDMKPDKFEPNDSIETSTDLGLLSQMNYWYDISIHPEDSDWFKFAIADTGRSDNYVSINYWYYGDHLNFSLYDAEGVLINSSSSEAMNGISLEGLEAGTYHIKVYGDEGITRPSYSLNINAPWNMTPDRFEANDSIENATDLGLLSQWNSWDNLSIHAGDSDWFKFDTSETGIADNYVSLGSYYYGDNLNFALYNAEGILINTARSDASESISLKGLEAGTYHVKVYGDEGAIIPSYILYINAPWNIEPDRFEANNSIEFSTDLGLLSQWNSWYKLSIHDAGDSD